MVASAFGITFTTHMYARYSKTTHCYGKAISEPMLAYCEIDHSKEIQCKLYRNNPCFLQDNELKYPMQDGGHLFSTFMCQRITYWLRFKHK